MIFKRSIIAIIAVLFLAIAAVPVWYGAHFLLKKRMESVLSDYGLSDASVPLPHIRGKHLLFETIQLDTDGFSTIGSLRTSFDFGKSFSPLVIDDLVMTGELENGRFLRLDGWKRPALFTPPDRDETILNSAQINLMTSAGAIRLQAKGQSRKQPDGSYKISAALWAVQHQLKMDTRWTAALYPDGDWEFETEIRDAGLTLDYFSASRISGWASLSKIKTGSPVTGGQLAIGHLNLSGLNLRNVAVTLSGPYDRYHIIFQGSVAGFKDMVVNADIDHDQNGDLSIHASIESLNLTDILKFLQKLQKGVKKIPSRPAALTALLITPGNFDRIKKDVRQIQYDSLVLEIDGPFYDLTGKIVGKKIKNGTLQRSVISLDPG